MSASRSPAATSSSTTRNPEACSAVRDTPSALTASASSAARCAAWSRWRARSRSWSLPCWASWRAAAACVASRADSCRHSAEIASAWRCGGKKGGRGKVL